MAKRSAGLLLYRRRGTSIEVFLVHPGGPFWAKKDVGAWSIPKGEYVDGEDPLSAAPHVHVAGVVPALGRVLQQVHGADRECRTGHVHAGWKCRVLDEADFGKRAAWLDQSRTGFRIVDQVRALQV